MHTHLESSSVPTRTYRLLMCRPSYVVMMVHEYATHLETVGVLLVDEC